jgi:hypothetical protein
MALSAVYHLLTSPFYAGVILWDGKTYQGRHRPVVTLDEFERVQTILGRPSRPRPKIREFSYAGLIRCGDCGLSVTAEVKTNRFGSVYTYYHCTKKRTDVKCSQPVIEVKNLEEQLAAFLSEIRLPERFETIVTAKMQEISKDDDRVHGANRHSLELSIADTKRQLDNLTTLRLREMIADEDFVLRRQALEQEQLKLSQALEKTPKPGSWIEPARELVLFPSDGVLALLHAEHQTRRLIVGVTGSNLLLKDKRTTVDAARPFVRWKSTDGIPELLAWLQDVRTFCLDPASKDVIEKIREIRRRLKEQKKAA